MSVYRTNLPYRTSHMTNTPLAICIQEKVHTDRVHRAMRIVTLVAALCDQRPKGDARLCVAYASKHSTASQQHQDHGPRFAFSCPTVFRAYRGFENKRLKKRERRCTSHPTSQAMRLVRCLNFGENETVLIPKGMFYEPMKIAPMCPFFLHSHGMLRRMEE
jgi:hypothetical protein